MKIFQISLVIVLTFAMDSVAEENDFFDYRDIFILQMFGFDFTGCEIVEIKDKLDLFFKECKSLKEVEEKLIGLVIEQGRFTSKFDFCDNKAYGSGSGFIFSGNDECSYSEIELLIFRLPQHKDSFVATFRFLRIPYCDEVFFVFCLDGQKISIHEMRSLSPYFDPWKDSQESLRTPAEGQKDL